MVGKSKSNPPIPGKGIDKGGPGVGEGCAEISRSVTRGCNRSVFVKGVVNGSGFTRDVVL